MSHERLLYGSGDAEIDVAMSCLNSLDNPQTREEPTRGEKRCWAQGRTQNAVSERLHGCSLLLSERNVDGVFEERRRMSERFWLLRFKIYVREYLLDDWIFGNE